MKFRDNKHFSEFFKLSFDELASLEKTFGYTSYNSRIDQVIDELDLVTSLAEFNKFMKKNQNYMTTKARNGEACDERIINPNSYTSIANKDGLYIIGNTTYRIIGEFMFSSSTEKTSQLMKLNYSDLKSKNGTTGFNVKKYISTYDDFNLSNLKSTTYLGGFFEDIAYNGNKKRVILQAFADTEILPPYYPSGHEYFIKLFAKGQKKSWITGRWRDVRTQVNIYGTDPQPIPPLAGTDVIVETPYNWGTQQYVISHISGNVPYLERTLFSRYYYTSGLGDPIYFTRVKLKANTSDTGTNFAVISEP